jgi:hypothetical protein
VFAAWWEGVDWGLWAPTAELGRLLWPERDTLLQELAGLPAGLVGHRWPAVTAGAGVADWARALWATALAPLAMLGAVDVPARLAAATAMAGPHAPPSLGVSACN